MISRCYNKVNFKGKFPIVYAAPCRTETNFGSNIIKFSKKKGRRPKRVSDFSYFVRNCGVF